MPENYPGTGSAPSQIAMSNGNWIIIPPGHWHFFPEFLQSIYTVFRVHGSIPSSRARRSLRYQEIAPRIKNQESKFNFLPATLCAVVGFILRRYDCSKVIWWHRSGNIGHLQSCCIGWFVWGETISFCYASSTGFELQRGTLKVSTCAGVIRLTFSLFSSPSSTVDQIYVLKFVLR